MWFITVFYWNGSHYSQTPKSLNVILLVTDTSLALFLFFFFPGNSYNRANSFYRRMIHSQAMLNCNLFLVSSLSSPSCMLDGLQCSPSKHLSYNEQAADSLILLICFQSPFLQTNGEQGEREDESYPSSHHHHLNFYLAKFYLSLPSQSFLLNTWSLKLSTHHSVRFD